MTKTTIKSYGNKVIEELNSLKYQTEEFKIITSYTYGSDVKILHYDIAYIDYERTNAIIVVEVRTDSKTCGLYNFINISTWLNPYLLKRINKALESLSQKSFIGVAE